MDFRAVTKNLSRGDERWWHQGDSVPSIPGMKDLVMRNIIGRGGLVTIANANL